MWLNAAPPKPINDLAVTRWSFVITISRAFCQEESPGMLKIAKK